MVPDEENTPTPTATPNPDDRVIPAVLMAGQTISGSTYVQVAWAAPRETPQNYQVNWGLLANTAYPTGASNNAYPTGTKYTITLNSHTIPVDPADRVDVYKVRVRACYSDGTCGAWSGDLSI